MIIDNRLTSTKATLFFWIFGFLSLSLLLWSFINGWKTNLIPLSFGILFTFLYVLLALSKPYYFSFKDANEKLVFRFYNAHPFFMKPRAIELNNKLLAKYEVKKKLWGLQKFIIIHQHTPKGIAKYPPISVSAVGPQQWEKLDKTLKMQVTYAQKFQKKN